MSQQQSKTFDLYNEASFVDAFHQQAVGNSHMETTARRFASMLAGPRILDAGCGTGRDTCRFQQWGYQAVGVDYSKAMIERARQYAQQLALPNPPQFEVLDMRQLSSHFPPASFDGAWVSASLIHIPEPEVPAVLSGLHHVLTAGGKAFFAMKAGPQGTRLVQEFKYDREIEREFTFWEQHNFEHVLQAAEFQITACEEGTGGTTGGEVTRWLNVYADVVK